MPPQDSSTKLRILNVAEKLFAEQGFDATSLRMITTLADANLAAVNYHFQSKEALLDAVYSRRALPVNERRLQLLDAAQLAANGAPVDIATLLDAFFRPVIETAETVHHLPHLMLRLLYLDNSENAARLFEKLFRPVLQRFLPAFRQALPHLSPPELVARLQFAAGAFAHSLVESRSRQLIAPGLESPSLDKTLHRFVQFTAAGLRAPSTEEIACAS